MYRIYLNNFSYFLDGSWNTLDEAKQAARKAGFESSIMMGSEVVLCWSPIGGFRRLY